MGSLTVKVVSNEGVPVPFAVIIFQGYSIIPPHWVELTRVDSDGSGIFVLGASTVWLWRETFPTDSFSVYGSDGGVYSQAVRFAFTRSGNFIPGSVNLILNLSTPPSRPRDRNWFTFATFGLIFLGGVYFFKDRKILGG